MVAPPDSMIWDEFCIILFFNVLFFTVVLAIAAPYIMQVVKFLA